MCTVTVIPLTHDGAGEPGALRLACNRDESRRRPAARPPVVRTFGVRRAILPVDPVSDGTWIGVNDAGLVATLLNVNPDLRDDSEADARPPPAAGDVAPIRNQQSGPPAAPGMSRPPSGLEVRSGGQDARISGALRPGSGAASRGEIIPGLLHCASLEELVAATEAIDLEQFPPFRLLAVDQAAAFSLRSDGARAVCERCAWRPGPLMFTSSGLGDALVESPRAALLAEFFSGRPASSWPEIQAAYHRHSWPDRPQVSVCMRRPDAHTVSYTVVDVSPVRVVLRYHAAPPDQPGLPAELSLDRTA